MSGVIHTKKRMFLFCENVNYMSASKLRSLIGEIVVFEIIAILRKFSDFNTR